VRRAAKNEIEAPGQDSFLDVVCNLVGILIVLVMLIAAQAKRGMVAAASAPPSDSAKSAAEQDAAAAESAAQSVELSIHELQAKINRQNLEAAVRQQERDKVQMLVTIAEQRLAEHREQLSGDERSRYDLEQQLAAAQRELMTLQTQQVSLARPQPQILEHLPTPMARTVFGTEVHFRLLGGRLAYLPWEEMLQRLKSDAPQHVQKLKGSSRVELSLPAIGGFGARYILRKVDAQLQTRVGTATQSSIELEQIYFVDAESNLGQPVAAVLAPNSEFRSRLAEHKPQSTTVTIWVYPDSFDDFRTIKAELFKLGYLTAARPLPEGYPISGGPEGSRSSAE